MGTSFLWPGDGELYRKSPIRSVSFNGRGSDRAILGAWGSGKLVVKGYLSFGRRNDPTDPFRVETEFSIAKSSSPKPEAPVQDLNPGSFKRTRFAPSIDISSTATAAAAEFVGSPKHEAAVKLQKVYKSFRTRRQLADCAVLVGQRWWKLLDFALLKHSSVSFFDVERPESVVSKWSRAKSRAAKVGKGLSKDEKAQKLALQHWLEAIDPRHRYGHNLHFYYDCWLRCESRQPFFYWLDVGEGKEVSIDERCARSKLQQQCIKYLGPKEREAYEVIVEDGKFLYKKTRRTLDTSEGPDDTKWIFVLSTSKTLYVGQKRKGKFQHSSFLAGGATSAAGRLEVENGSLKSVWPHSGHYCPTEENFQEFMNFLKDNNVDLTDVKESPTGEEEEELWSKLRVSRSELSLSSTVGMTEDTKDDDRLLPDPECQVAAAGAAEMKEEEEEEEHSIRFRKANLFAEEGEESEEDDKEEASVSASVASEVILRRMNSKKGLKSLQLGKQLSFKWTTGAGPRIGCVRDYPSELQARALEQVSLSPRSSSTTTGGGASRFCSSPRNLHSPTPKLQEIARTNSGSRMDNIGRKTNSLCTGRDDKDSIYLVL